MQPIMSRIQGRHDNEVLHDSNETIQAEQLPPVISFALPGPELKLQALARRVINEIADGKGDERFRLAESQSDAQYREFESLLHAIPDAGTAENGELQRLLAGVTATEGCSFREAVSLLLGLITPTGMDSTDQAAIARALQRPVLSRTLMAKVQKVFEDSEIPDEWENRLALLDTRSIIRTDAVFEALCNALQEALDSAGALSPDEDRQREYLRHMIAAAQAECHYHHEVRYSVKQLLWESVQIMEGEQLVAADNLKDRHALLAALLPTQAEFNTLWEDKNYPMDQWMAWRHSDNRLPSELMAPVRLEVLKAIAWKALTVRPGSHVDLAEDRYWGDLVLHTLNRELSRHSEPEKENGLSAEQKKHLRVLLRAVQMFEGTQYPDGEEYSDGKQLGVLIRKVLTTPYDDRDKKATSALEYLLGELLPAVNDPLLENFLTKVDVAEQEKLVSRFRDDLIKKGGFMVGTGQREEKTVVAATGDFIRHALADSESDMTSSSQQASASPGSDIAQFSVLKEHLYNLRDRRPVTLVAKVIQHLTDADGETPVEESLTGQFIGYLREDLDNELVNLDNLEESSSHSGEASRVKEIKKEKEEILELDLQLEELEARGENLFTYRELAGVMTEVLQGSGSPEAGHGFLPKEEQLCLWRELLNDLLPARDNTGWNRDWQKLDAALNRSVLSNKVLDPLRKKLENFVENIRSLKLKGSAVRQDVIFMTLIAKLAPVLNVLEGKQDSFTPDEQKQIKILSALFESAKEESLQEEYRYSPDSLLWEMSRLIHGQPLNYLGYSARRELLKELVPVTWTRLEGRLEQHGGLWGMLADFLSLKERSLSAEIVVNMGNMLSDGLKAGPHFDADLEPYGEGRQSSVLFFLSLVRKALATSSAQEHHEIDVLLNTIERLQIPDFDLSWSELKEKAEGYLKTPEKERFVLSHSFFDDLLHQVLPSPGSSGSPGYGWSPVWDGLLATWQRPVGDAPGAHKDGHVAVLTEAIAGEIPQQTGTVLPEIHVLSAILPDPLPPALMVR